MRRLDPIPPVRRVSPDEATTLPSFADWMATCLYDAKIGFYSAGRVSFGEDGDFYTFPQQLSPYFGWMLWDAASELLEPLHRAIGADERIVVLEFGGGDGDLAADLLDRTTALAREGDALAARVTYRIVESSAALRERQAARLAEHVSAGRAEVVAGSIVDYRSPEPFCGFAFANEVLDALPCEQLTIEASGTYRTHVALLDRAGVPASRSELGARLSATPPEERRVEERHVALRDGWVDTRGGVGPPPDALMRHLEVLGPLIEDLRDARMVPSDYYWSPDVDRSVETMVELSRHGTGVGMFIDYGGTARHALDRSLIPHLRVYSRDDEPRRTENPYGRPGAVDITWDVDFTEVARSAQARGAPVHYAHQSALEGPRVRLDDVELPNAIDPDGVIAEFRGGRGFRMLTVGPPGYTFPVHRIGPSDAFDGRGLATLSRSATLAELHSALDEAGVPEAAPALGFCCDIVGTLSDVGRYHQRHDILTILERHGLLEW